MCVLHVLFTVFVKVNECDTETPTFWALGSQYVDAVKNESVYGGVCFSYFCVGF